MDEVAERDHFPKLEHLGEATPHVGRILEILQHIRLFDDFDRADIACLARYMRCYRAPAGAEIIREAEEGDFMLLLLDGTVEILKRDGRGLPARVGTAGPGKTLGEMSLIDGEPRFASCFALAETTFAVLDREQLTRVIADEPAVGVKLLMELLMLLNQRLRAVSGELMRCVENNRLRIR